MRQILFFIALILSTVAFGQSSKWEFSLQIQPEMTFHKDSYPRWKDNSSKSTINIGVASAVQYNFNERFFINSGLGFISRKLRTANVLDQAALPPPKQSFTNELVTTKSVQYRLVSVPINVGYYFLSGEKIKSFITTGFSGNYLLNTYYTTNFERYDGKYKMNYWQGYSLTLGLGADFKLNKKMHATSSLSYALLNRVKADEYIAKQDDAAITLAHKYLNLSVGLRIPL
jgi:opacity protein-like surface antigen